MDSVCDLEAAVEKYFEALGLREPEALREATVQICRRVEAQSSWDAQLAAAVSLARSWVIEFCVQHNREGQAWLDAPRLLARWPMTFACSELPALHTRAAHPSWVAPRRAALSIREQELDVSIASLADAAGAVFQDAAFVVLEWARLR
jgi:hypothetical protein